jgi:hypothetical protein
MTSNKIEPCCTKLEVRSGVPAIEGFVVVHFQANGSMDYLISGDKRFRLFVVDERAPHDRVYEMTKRCSKERVAAVLGNDPIGHAGDSRNAAIVARIREYVEGTPRLRVVDVPEPSE